MKPYLRVTVEYLLRGQHASFSNLSLYFLPMLTTLLPDVAFTSSLKTLNSASSLWILRRGYGHKQEDTSHSCSSRQLQEKITIPKDNQISVALKYGNVISRGLLQLLGRDGLSWTTRKLSSCTEQGGNGLGGGTSWWMTRQCCQRGKKAPRRAGEAKARRRWCVIRSKEGWGGLQPGQVGFSKSTRGILIQF